MARLGRLGLLVALAALTRAASRTASLSRLPSGLGALTLGSDGFHTLNGSSSVPLSVPFGLDLRLNPNL